MRQKSLICCALFAVYGNVRPCAWTRSCLCLRLYVNEDENWPGCHPYRSRVCQSRSPRAKPSSPMIPQVCPTLHKAARVIRLMACRVGAAVRACVRACVLPCRGRVVLGLPDLILPPCAPHLCLHLTLPYGPAEAVTPKIRRLQTALLNHESKTTAKSEKGP